MIALDVSDIGLKPVPLANALASLPWIDPMPKALSRSQTIMSLLGKLGRVRKTAYSPKSSAASNSNFSATGTRLASDSTRAGTMSVGSYTA